MTGTLLLDPTTVTIGDVSGMTTTTQFWLYKFCNSSLPSSTAYQVPTANNAFIVISTPQEPGITL